MKTNGQRHTSAPLLPGMGLRYQLNKPGSPPPKFDLKTLLKYSLPLSKTEKKPSGIRPPPTISPILTELPHLYYYQSSRRHMSEDLDVITALRNLDCAKAIFSAFSSLLQASVPLAVWRCGNIVVGAVGFVGRVTTASIELYLFWCHDVTDLWGLRLYQRNIDSNGEVSQYAYWLVSDNLIGKNTVKLVTKSMVICIDRQRQQFIVLKKAQRCYMFRYTWPPSSKKYT